ncbi:accessory factor UbiK family protein [Parvularcula maris]|uniref:Accessory factor UbiK family protein n=1 Tax=Parvularcula maris TaxID=2965077 RepID=A0A9X2RJS0_9PROT|nr:accessory factor UbiK family protein [Parvularcula maris]MCQ8185028.1 accessory factor UbiK family protein [Parvularcula maris]
MQTRSPVFDGVAKLIAETAGTINGVRREAETALSSQLQRYLADQDLVTREEFETVQEMAVLLREEVDALKAELAALRVEKGSA